MAKQTAKCDTCDGKGWVPASTCDCYMKAGWVGVHFCQLRTCPACGGSGQ